MHYEILDAKRIQYLPQIKEVGVGFYLAGGTALALQVGHRDSIDFDFFCETDIDAIALWKKIETVFANVAIIRTQESFNTLSCTIAEDIKLSFFGYLYPLALPLQSEDGFVLASLVDIGAMKLSAITSRATIKDYIDLYFILKTVPLETLLAACTKKFPSLSQNLVLKSLVYFEDIVEEPIMFMKGFEVARSEAEMDLKEQVQAYVALRG